MKRVTVMIVLGLILSISVSAQYKVNKQNYNHKEYTKQAGDLYNPALAGVASVLIPGLGQMISDAPGRGVLFLGGYLVSYGVYYAGATEVVNSDGASGGGLLLVGGVSLLGIYIWNIADAVRVAKVNSMAARKSSSNFKVLPYVGNVPFSSKLTTGLTLQLNLN